MGTFDAALRFCRDNDELTVLHVQGSGDGYDSARELSTERFWRGETSKLSSTRRVDVNVRGYTPCAAVLS